MSDLKMTGTIKVMGELQSFESGFTKVEFVISTGGEYSQDVKFECVKEKADNLLKYNKVGDSVEVSFNIRGNEYQDKYYVNLVAWKVFKHDATAVSVPDVPAQQGAEPDNSEILPF